jgi:hypothetical protein
MREGDNIDASCTVQAGCASAIRVMKLKGNKKKIIGPISNSQSWGEASRGRHPDFTMAHTCAPHR